MRWLYDSYEYIETRICTPLNVQSRVGSDRIWEVFACMGCKNVYLRYRKLSDLGKIPAFTSVPAAMTEL